MKNLMLIKEMFGSELAQFDVLNLESSLSIAKEVYPSSRLVLQRQERLDDLNLISLKPSSLMGIPLQHHVPDEIDKPTKEILHSALLFLGQLPEESWSWAKSFLHSICFVKKDPAITSEGQITSLTLPGLPGISLFSKQALYHAPPSIIALEDSAEILAENILHESTHQIVNLLLLSGHLLNESYSADTSPLVTIPWRKSATEFRNKAWPLDRCLHALCVYAVVSDFRNFRREMPDTVFKSSHITEARNNLRFLATSLLNHSTYLDTKCRKLIETLLKNADLNELAS